jgi:carbamoyl-phosphate synthase large subunit
VKRNILISSAGRRVGLLACVRDSIAARGGSASVFTIDCGSTAPAGFVAGRMERVPRCTDPAFVDTVLHFCAKRQIGLLVPTIDTEIPVYAAAIDLFGSVGTTICVSRPEVSKICCDKISTHEWLRENGFPTVRQTGVRTALSHRAAWPLPLIAKPYNGSASIGVGRIQTELELAALAEMLPSWAH